MRFRGNYDCGPAFLQRSSKELSEGVDKMLVLEIKLHVVLAGADNCRGGSNRSDETVDYGIGARSRHIAVIRAF
jgi:hypothetical protein